MTVSIGTQKKCLHPKRKDHSRPRTKYLLHIQLGECLTKGFYCDKAKQKPGREERVYPTLPLIVQHLKTSERKCEGRS